MPAPLLQIDAFSNRPFGGNPAAVCLLERPADANWMQRVAAEMNLAETAFVVPGDGAFGLRWFTPTVEVGLCGHATLASAHALWETGRVPPTKAIAFQTQSGVLTAERDGDRIAISLPVRPVVECQMPAGLVEALGATPKTVTSTLNGDGGTAHGNMLLEFADEATVRGLAPRFLLLKELPFGVIATARAAHAPYDFVSRYFATPYGIDEDPVTGSAHCSLAPYWATVLRKTRFVAWQASARGGELQVALQGDRVRLGGYAVTVLKGELTA
jgi:PhzF family phenazine biosynthesis protein